MSLLRSITGGLRALFRKEQVSQELHEELNGFLEMAAEEKVRQGMSRKDALRAVRLERGNLEGSKEAVRAAGWESIVETCWQDLRFAIRVLRNNPGFTAAAVLAIALGVGINVGIFSVLNGAALRLLPIPRAEQVVSIDQILHGRFKRNAHNGSSMLSYSEYLDYRDHNHVFSGLLAYEPFVEATLGGGKMKELTGTLATCNYFEVLGEHPGQGRGFLESDCAAPGGNAVVVISDDLWRGTFASHASLVGKRIILNRTAYTVVGIAPPGFRGTEPIPSSFWAPITMQKALDPWSDRMADDNLSWLAVLGRVQPGVTMEQVRADLGVIAGRIDQLHPGRTTSLAIRTAAFFNGTGDPDSRRFCNSRGFRTRSAGGVRECGQSLAGAGVGAAEGNRTAAIHWRQPVAVGAAIADGEPSAFLDRGYARVAACILVLRSNHAAHNLSPTASGFHPRGECCARLPCARLRAGAYVLDGDRVWADSGFAEFATGPEHFAEGRRRSFRPGQKKRAVFAGRVGGHASRGVQDPAVGGRSPVARTLPCADSGSRI